MSQEHVTTCIDGTVRGYRGTSWKCTCGAGGAWAVRDGSAESDTYHHRLTVDPEFAKAEQERKALWREEQAAILARNREATAARRAEAEVSKAEPPLAVAEMVLTEEFEHLAEDHPNCKFEEPGMHGCSCHLNPPCGACENCPSWNEEAWEAGEP